MVRTSVDRRPTRRLGSVLVLVLTAVATAAPAGSVAGAVEDATFFQPVEPCRLLDTRDAPNRVRAGAVIEIDVAGRCGVPERGEAVAVTITAVRPERQGFLTAFPTGVDRPGTSTLNFRRGEVVANLQLVRLGVDGSISVSTTARTDVLVDVAGVFVAADGPVSAGRFVSVDAERVLDTRRTGRPAPGSSLVVETGVPDGAIAVAVNLTMTGTTGRGFLAASVPGSGLPEASLVNADGPGQVRAAAAIVPVVDGAFELFTSGGSHVIVDVVGYFTGREAAVGSEGLFVPIEPTRLADTRRATGPSGGPRLFDGGAREFAVDDLIGDTAGAVVVNVTVTRTEDRGFVVVHPAGTEPGETSSVNHASAGSTVANQVLVPISERGVTVTAREATHVVLDVVGWFTGTPVVASGPVPANDVPPLRRVVIIGDSAFAGIRWNGALGGLQGMVVDHRLESCRRLVAPSCRGREGYIPRTVVSELLAMPAAGAEDLLVVVAGYDDWYASFAGDFDLVVQTARSRGYHHIIWVTYRSDVGYRLPNGSRSNYGEMNRILFEKAASGDVPDVRIWDYDADTATAPAGWFYGDGIHERPLGSWGTADWLSRHVRGLRRPPVSAAVDTRGGACRSVPASRRRDRDGPRPPGHRRVVRTLTRTALISAGDRSALDDGDGDGDRFDDVAVLAAKRHGEAASRRLLVAVVHVAAGGAQCLDRLVEGDEMGAVAVEGEPGGVDRFDRRHRVALDARHLHEPTDRVTGETEVVFECDLGGVLDLSR